MKTECESVNKIHQASSLGRIRNLRTTRIISPYSRNGCKTVGLRDKEVESVSSSFRVNRLVAFTFLRFDGNQPDYQVDHINKDPSDNRLINLQILTVKEHALKDHGKKINM